MSDVLETTQQPTVTADTYRQDKRPFAALGCKISEIMDCAVLTELARAGDRIIFSDATSQHLLAEVSVLEQTNGVVLAMRTNVPESAWEILQQLIDNIEIRPFARQ